MATTNNNYKQTSHLPRVIYTEPAPLSGMNYSSTPLQSGYARIVYNLVENPDNTGLRPRPGASQVNQPLVLPTDKLTMELSSVLGYNTYLNNSEATLPYLLESVECEYGNIIHYLYKITDDLTLYWNSTMGSEAESTTPYVLGKPLEKVTEDPTINTIPICNVNNDIVYTKGFETNDLFVLCKNIQQSMETQYIDKLSPNAVWYEVDTTEGKQRPNNSDITYSIKREIKLTANSEHAAQTTTPIYYYKISNMRAYHMKPVLKEYSLAENYIPIPSVLTRYYDVADAYNRQAFGFTYNNYRYVTYVDLANAGTTFYKLLTNNARNTPVCFYKLPSKPAKGLRNFTVDITDIKVVLHNNGVLSLSFTYHDANGNSETQTLPSEYADFTLRYLGYGVLLKDLDSDIPKGSFRFSYTFTAVTGGLSTDVWHDKYSETYPDYSFFIYEKDHIASQVGYYPAVNRYKETNLVQSVRYTGAYVSLWDAVKAYGITWEKGTTYLFPDIHISIYFDSYANAPQPVTPKVPTIREALKYGYNMLLADPYAFSGTISSATTPNVQFGGLLVYDKNDSLVLNPIQNLNYTFKLITDTTSSTVNTCIRIDYKTTAQDVWNEIYQNITKPKPLKDYSNNVEFSWIPNVPSAIIRVRYYAQTEKALEETVYDNLEALQTELESVGTDSKYDGSIFAVKAYNNVYLYYRATYSATSPYYSVALEYYPEGDAIEDDLFKQGYRSLLTNSIAMSFERNYETNVSVRNYDFSTAQGMCYWFNRLVVWGVDQGSNILFLSDINDPSYFPYPNNISVFDEPIIKAIPFKDNLLVFTTTKIWSITLAEDGMTWYETCIQNNLRIKNTEAHLITPLATMVFFKSGYSYYLLTPSSKGTGDLVIANISKPIIDILQNPDTFFKGLDQQIYPNKYNLRDGPNYEDKSLNVFLDASEIHVVYSYKIANDKDFDDTAVDARTYRNYILSYSTTTRKWRIWSFDSDKVPKVLYKDAVNNAVWYTISSRILGLPYRYTGDVTYIESNKLYTFQFLSNTDKDNNNADVGIPGAHPTYQYLDTGNRDIRKEYYKKFREYQVSFVNRSNTDLSFNIEFNLDDVTIVPLYSGTIETGLIPNPAAEQTIYGTVLQLDSNLVYTINGTMWDLYHMMKCKAPITSKGYCPALHILSKNQYAYDLLDITWVYRLKNAR